jgi:Ca2+:H+ antiporter
MQTSLHACVKRLELADSVTLKFSRGMAVTLLGVFVLFLHFQIRTHAQMSGDVQHFQAGEEGLEGKTYAPVSAQASHEDLSEAIPMHTVPTRGLRAQAAHVVVSPQEPDAESSISKRASLILLLVSAGLVSFCAEFLVDSIEHVIADAPLTEAFLGLIILPLLGNAAEMGTAITVAVRNKIDLAINVTVGSAIQITLFMAPAMVILGWITGKELSLYFDMFQTVTLLATLMIVNIMMLSGRSNYLLGMLLCSCYVVIGYVQGTRTILIRFTNQRTLQNRSVLFAESARSEGILMSMHSEAMDLGT